MQALEEQQSVYRQEFEAARNGASEPEWLAQRRLAAIERFEQRGFPTRRDEAWRNLDLNAFGQHHFVAAALAETAVAAAMPGLEAAIRLVFVDGYFNAAESNLTDLPKGLQVTPLKQAMAEDDALARQELDRQVPEDHPFAALNMAFATDGVVVRTAAGALIERPVLLEFVRTPAAGQAAYPRVLIDAESGSELSVIEHYRGPGDSVYFTCPVTEIRAGANAGVHWYKMQEEGAEAFHFALVAAELARDARANLHSFSGGGKQARTDVNIVLAGDGADASLNGLYITDDGQYADHHTRVEHRVGYCHSAQHFRGVLNGKSEAVYDGLVKVDHGAAKTDAQQQNRNMLLSRRALAHSNPRLEIHTDDVKCSHGSTVGELDPEALFYLRSRGLGTEQAQGLLIYAFVEELLTPIRIEALRDYVRQALFSRLPGDYTVREMV